jgi:uncharacterized protein YcbK (DUF882 family)
MQRRTFLLSGLAALAVGPRVLQAKIDTSPRTLSFYHTHTNDTLDVVYRPKKGLAPGTLSQLDHFLRDFRTEETVRIDSRLFDLLHGIKLRTGNRDGVFEIISAYRSPKTNRALRKKSKGVAKRSYHMLGKALDIRLRGTPTSELRDIAIAMKRGGVGYYRRSDFIHVDTGSVRYW